MTNFLLLQDHVSSGKDINSVNIKQLKLILSTWAGEPCGLKTKAMDTEDEMTGILQLSPEFSDRRTFLGKEKFWNSQAEREDCEKFDHCSHFRAKRDTWAFIYFFPLKDPERRVREQKFYENKNSRIAAQGMTSRGAGSFASSVRRTDCQQESSLGLRLSECCLGEQVPTDRCSSQKKHGHYPEINGNVYSSHS